VPAENPITDAKRVLGKILFWDEQLSSDDTVACGTCHQPVFAGSDPRPATHPGVDSVLGTADDIQGSLGIIRADESNTYFSDPVFGLAPQVGTRAAPSAIGSQWAPQLFWDGRAGPRFVDPQTGVTVITVNGALEAQSSGPPVNDVEMAHESRDWSEITAKLASATPLALARNLPADVATALAAHPTYASLFGAAFGDTTVSAQRIAFAIATYERTLVPDQTPFDAFVAGNTSALTAQQQAGLNAFRNTTCGACHRPALFTDNTFRNIGLRPVAEDQGRQAITGNPGDRGRFKVPTLRNVGLKTEFMHTGHLASLEQVLDFYLRANGQVQFPDNQDPLVQQIQIPPNQVAAVVDFLRHGLTDSRVASGVFPFDRPTLAASPDQCSDGADNDGDGLADGDDPGCVSGADTSERAVGTTCDDGLDNDGDGAVDLADADCASLASSEDGSAPPPPPTTGCGSAAGLIYVGAPLPVLKLRRKRR
jgi:cytochrome c peroxidase